MNKSKVAIVVVILLVVGLVIRRLAIQSVPVSREPGNLGNLGMLRSAISIFYGDAEGHYPSDLIVLVPHYIPAVPTLNIKEHAPTNKVVLAQEEVSTDSGGWLYVVNPQSKSYGGIRIDCTHSDGKRPWFEN